jgi:hypothetical protein
MMLTRAQGRLFILKLQDRSDHDEALTLDSPGIRQQVLESLTNSRKQLLAASYQAIAMNEARIENFLAKRVVDNPNELSGARPASVANTTATPVSNSSGSVTNLTNSNAPTNNAANAKPATPVSSPAAKPTASPKATAPASTGNANRPR